MGNDKYLLAEAEAREAKTPTADERIDSALEAIYLRYGPNLAQFFEDVKKMEAREAQQPTAADIAVADELERLAEHVQTLPCDDYRDDIRRICRNRAEDLRRGVKRGPTAEQVIAAAERAFHRIYWDHEDAKDMEREAKEMMAAIAKWKEAQ